MRVKSTGRLPIIPGDFVTPISFVFPQESEVLNDEVLRTEPKNPEVKLVKETHTIQISPLLTPMLYPQIAKFGARGGEEPNNCQVEAISCKCRRPRQIVLTPGCPSPLRPKNPPKRAIQKTD